MDIIKFGDMLNWINTIAIERGLGILFNQNILNLKDNNEARG